MLRRMLFLGCLVGCLNLFMAGCLFKTDTTVKTPEGIYGATGTVTTPDPPKPASEEDTN